MATYIISYDLNSPGQDYDSLYKAIKSCSAWWHHLDSTWCVVSTMTATEIRDKIAAKIDSNDKLLVVKSAGVAAWRGFNDSASKWLKNNI